MKKRIQSVVFLTLAVLGCILGSVRTQAAGMAAERYAGYKLCSVLDYGADASGSKNSASAFLEAVSEASASETPAVVYVPAGKYKIASMVQIRSQVIIAADQGAEIQGECENPFFIRSDNVTFDGGTWTGNQDQSQILIKVFQVKNFSLLNAAVNNTGIGLHFNLATGNLDGDNFSKNKDRAVRISGKSTVTVKNTIVKSNGFGYYNKNKGTGDVGHGITVNESTLNIENSTLANNTQCGISLVKAKAVVKKCTLKKNGRHGIGTYDVCSLNVKNSSIIQNGYDTKEQANGHNGVILVDGSKGTFTNCNISKNKNTGVWVAKKGTKATFKNVVLNGNKLVQINITGDATGKVTVNLNNCTMKNASLGLLATGKYKITKKGKQKFTKVQRHYWYP